MKGLDVVGRLPYVDSTRMGAAGASYGGYMIYWIAGHTGRFKVLVDHDGVFNPLSMAGSTEELWFVDWEFGGTPYANRALYSKWSPLNFVQNWKTPLLIVRAQLDYRVDLAPGAEAFTPDPHAGRPFGDRRLEVGAHADRQGVQAEPLGIHRLEQLAQRPV